MPLVAIATTDKTLNAECKNISQAFSIPFFNGEAPPDYLLTLAKTHLSITKYGDKKLNPFYIDFCEGKLAYRGARANMELLSKAIGLKKLSRPTVLDTTAGLGRDGFLLASLGCDVLMLESNAILFLLLDDAL